MKNFNKTASIAHAEDLIKTLAAHSGVDVPSAGRTVPEMPDVPGVPGVPVAVATPAAPTVPIPEPLRRITDRMGDLIAVSRVRLPAGV